MFNRRTKDQLLEAGALQRAIFNSAHFSSIATDAKGVIQIFNVGAERMLGYAATDVVNKITPADISDPLEVVARAKELSKELHSSIAPGFEALIFKASRGIEDIYELTYIRKDGSRFPAIVSVTALRDAQNAIIGYLLIGTDNTARKKAEEALVKAGALQSAIFNSANFSSIATDAQGVIQIFNVGAERMLGYAAADVVNKITPADISDPLEVVARAKQLSKELHSSIAPGFEALVFKASRGIEDIYELTYIRKDGSRFPAVVSVTALRDADASIIGYLLIGTDNTARKRAEIDLRESQERFRTVVEAVPQMVWITRADGWNIYFSQKWMDYTGLTLEESLGHGWNKPFHPEDHQRAWDAWQNATMTRDGTYRVECRLRRADGVYRWFLILGVRQLDFDGTTDKWFGTCTDITLAKLSEEQLQLATEQFRLALEAAPTGMLMIDEAGAIVLVNAQIETIFGYGRNELIGGRLEMLLPERFRAHHPGLRQAFAVDPKTRTMGAGRELFGLHKNGTEVPIEIGLNPLNIAEGRFVLTAITDMTERKRASETQQRMTALVQSTSDAIVTKDLSGIIRSWNPAAEILLGYTAEEIIGQAGALLIPADREAEEDNISLRIKQGLRIAPFETIRLRKDGSTVEVSVTISPLLADGGQIVGASKIMRDITQERAAAGALRAANSQLELRITMRTAELKERESLLQEIHHRVKNNLQVISSLINMQIRGLEDESSRLALRDCQSRVMTMAQIHEMLYQSADYARVPFAKYARDLTTRILSASGTSPGNVTVQFAMEEVSLPVAQAIPCGLILNELVANSLKHAFPHARRGTIRVELGFGPDLSVILSVSDDGIGIPPSLNMKTLSSLGVQLVMNLVEQLEGHIEITRQPGSTFQISFPLESHSLEFAA